MSRILTPDRPGSQRDLERLLSTVLAAELLAPSRELWIVASTVADIALLDNRAGVFRGLDPNWPSRAIRLSELLAAFVRTGGMLIVITEKQDGGNRFLESLRAAARDAATPERLVIREVDELHSPLGLLGDAWVLNGPVSLTGGRSGGVRGELRYEVDADSIAGMRVEFETAYGKLR